MLNLVHLQTLQAVLESGSFSAAGKRLGYTTSAISQQISTLERSLGVQLFERGPRNLWPTYAAKQIGSVAGVILARLEEFEAEVQIAARVDRGRLRVSSFPSAGARVLPRVLAQLVRQYPKAEFSLHEENKPLAVAEAVDTARADLGLVYEHDTVPEQWPEGLSVRPILDEEIVVLTGATRRKPLAARVDLESLADELWVVNRPDTAGRLSFEHWCAQVGFRPKVRFETNNFDVIRGVVRENLGIAFIPALSLGVDKTITMHRLDDVTPRRRVYAVHRGPDPNPLLAKAIGLISEAADEFIRWTTTGFVTDTEHTPLASRTTSRGAKAKKPLTGTDRPADSGQ